MGNKGRKDLGVGGKGRRSGIERESEKIKKKILLYWIFKGTGFETFPFSLS